MTISLLVIRCSNIETSKRFYECLGFTFKKEQHGKGPEHYASEKNGFVFELYPVIQQATETPQIDHTRLGFNVSRLTKVIAHLDIINQYE